MSENDNVGKRCLKCAHIRKPGDSEPYWACPQCMAVYAKLEKLEAEGRISEAFRTNAVTPTLSRMQKPAPAAETVRTNVKPAFTPAKPRAEPSPLVECGDCKAQISRRALSCPQCGAPVPQAAKPAFSQKKVSGSAAAWIIGLSIVFIFLPLMRVGDDTPRPAATAIVSNSEWDGSVRQVERYLKGSLKDPDSYQSVEWSKVINMPDGSFAVRHKYRAKNSFGGYMVEEQIFNLSASGVVTSAVPTR